MVERGFAVDEEQKPAFSIMCSAYRCEEYLPGTIESVLAQTSGD